MNTQAWLLVTGAHHGARELCEAQTKTGRRCGIDADRLRGARWFCHVHDPCGTFQCQCECPRGAVRPQAQTAPIPINLHGNLEKCRESCCAGAAQTMYGT